MKEHKGIIGAVIVLLIIVFGMSVFTYLQRLEVHNYDTQTTSQSDPIENYKNVTHIDADHYFNDGAHALVGEIELPTMCDLLSWDVIIAESYPEQVSVNFSVEKHADECAQVITNQPFQIIFDASERASIRARFEGEPVDLNLKEVLMDEEVAEFNPLGIR